MSETPSTPVPDNPLVPLVLPGYRGTEQHGVPQSGEPDFTGEHDLGDPTSFEPDDDDQIPPIPVRIIAGKKTKTVTAWRAMRYVLTLGETVMILPRMDTRLSVIIKNVSTADVVIGSENMLSAFTGWLLIENEQVTIPTTEPVYALAPDADAELNLMITYARDI